MVERAWNAAPLWDSPLSIPLGLHFNSPCQKRQSQSIKPGFHCWESCVMRLHICISEVAAWLIFELSESSGVILVLMASPVICLISSLVWKWLALLAGTWMTYLTRVRQRRLASAHAEHHINILGPNNRAWPIRPWSETLGPACRPPGCIRLTQQTPGCLWPGSRPTAVTLTRGTHVAAGERSMLKQKGMRPGQRLSESRIYFVWQT